MRATPEVGMNVCFKSQERSANPVVMQIDSLVGNDKANVIGFTKSDQPFKIEVNLANLEKININRLRNQDEK
jgi:hypothetical protein